MEGAEKALDVAVDKGRKAGLAMVSFDDLEGVGRNREGRAKEAVDGAAYERL